MAQTIIRMRPLRIIRGLVLYGLALIGLATIVFVIVSYGWNGEPPTVSIE